MVYINIFKCEKFLGFFDLESGGIIIGALGLLFAEFQLVVHTILLFSITFAGNFCFLQYFIDSNINGDIFTKKQQNLSQNAFSITQDDLDYVTNFEFICTEINRTPYFIILTTAISLNIISIIAHYKIIKGVEECNSAKFSLALSYYKFLIAVKAIFVTIWTFFSIKLIFAAISILILLSIFIDVYVCSIIDKLRVKYLNEPLISFIFGPDSFERSENKFYERRKSSVYDPELSIPIPNYYKHLNQK